MVGKKLKSKTLTYYTLEGLAHMTDVEILIKQAKLERDNYHKQELSLMAAGAKAKIPTNANLLNAIGFCLYAESVAVVPLSRKKQLWVNDPNHNMQYNKWLKRALELLPIFKSMLEAEEEKR